MYCIKTIILYYFEINFHITSLINFSFILRLDSVQYNTLYNNLFVQPLDIVYNKYHKKGSCKHKNSHKYNFLPFHNFLFYFSYIYGIFNYQQISIRHWNIHLLYQHKKNYHIFLHFQTLCLHNTILIYYVIQSWEVFHNID